jgi:hypothetical protein
MASCCSSMQVVQMVPTALESGKQAYRTPPEDRRLRRPRWKEAPLHVCEVPKRAADYSIVQYSMDGCQHAAHCQYDTPHTGSGPRLIDGSCYALDTTDNSNIATR